ncbi:hypothetical protein ACFE04_016016 [Oxalis oulophora]
MDTCFIDDLLLDFAADIDEDDEITRQRNACSLPEFAEEELEWLSNKEAFPSVDDILLQQPINNFSKSPVSVLETNTTTTVSSPASTTTNGIVASCCVSLQAPVRKRRSRRRRCENHQPWWSCKELILKSVIKQASRTASTSHGQKCLHCGSEETPQWRAGPMGPKTLCNACGVRYKSGRLVPEYRPASSPTFSSKLHSNSHRKVVEMRKKKQMMGQLMVMPSCSVDKAQQAPLPTELSRAAASACMPQFINVAVNLRGVSHEPWWSSKELILKSVTQQANQTASTGGALHGRKCLHCGLEETPPYVFEQVAFEFSPQVEPPPLEVLRMVGNSGRLVPEYSPASSSTFSSNLRKASRTACDGGASHGRKCLHCGSEETPQGPMDKKILCYACGVKFKRCRLVPEYRPASSPTFSSELHLNAIRKVVEMRKKKQMMGSCYVLLIKVRFW